MTELWDRVDALDDGRGFVDRSGDRTLVVRGADARAWLGDLVTADVATLGRGSSRRSLLLTPTGRIRADLWIVQTDDDSFLLLQAVDQPEPIHELLGPYVLSSRVTLEDMTDASRTIFFPARGEIDAGPREGLAAQGRMKTERGSLLVDEQAYEVWRVVRGEPRMGVDFDAGALPAEAGLEHLIDVEKGCFLGQESVAKVRNLGHPPTVLRHLRSEAVVASDSTVHVTGEVVGTVTSVAPHRSRGSVLIARVEWRAADAALLHLADGGPLFPLPD
jgi:tRNA-modifying protein YgfZ